MPAGTRGEKARSESPDRPRSARRCTGGPPRRARARDAPANPPVWTRTLCRIYLMNRMFAPAFAAGAVVLTLAAQTPDRVDFQRDVQPIFRQHCYGCHGPTIHENGFRLDRRADAMRGG